MLPGNTNRRVGDAAARQAIDFGKNSPAVNSQTAAAEQDLIDLVLSELKHVSACLRFVDAEVCMIGRQLRVGAISVEQAQWMVSHLTDPIGLLEQRRTRS